LIENKIKMTNVSTMAKQKSKSVIINADTHGDFKTYCKGKSLKIGGVIEDLIKLYLSDPRTIQKLIDSLEDDS
jgi:hypothetical protein